MEQLIATLSTGDVQTAILVILAVFAALAVADKGISAYKNIFHKGEKDVDKRLSAIETHEATDKRRLDHIDTQLARVDDDMEHILAAMNSMLMHEITGNDISGLKDTKAELDDYMARRGRAGKRGNAA